MAKNGDEQVPAWLEEAAHDQLIQDAHSHMTAAEGAAVAADRARDEAERQGGSPIPR
jgi:hypothetical protein